MFASLALVCLATAAFAAGVVRWRTRTTPPAPYGVDREQVQGFFYVGSAALALVGGVVVGLGVAGLAGAAEAVAVLGLMAYLLYLLIAAVLIARHARRHPAPRRRFP